METRRMTLCKDPKDELIDRVSRKKGINDENIKGRKCHWNEKGTKKDEKVERKECFKRRKI